MSKKKAVRSTWFQLLEGDGTPIRGQWVEVFFGTEKLAKVQTDEDGRVKVVIPDDVYERFPPGRYDFGVKFEGKA